MAGIDNVIYLIRDRGCTVEEACKYTSTTDEEYSKLHKEILETGIISRNEARMKGMTRYKTGKRCKWNHIAERYTSTGMCVECSNLHSKKYHSQLKKSREGKVRMVVWVHPDDVTTINGMTTALDNSRKPGDQS